MTGKVDVLLAGVSLQQCAVAARFVLCHSGSFGVPLVFGVFRRALFGGERRRDALDDIAGLVEVLDRLSDALRRHGLPEILLAVLADAADRLRVKRERQRGGEHRKRSDDFQAMHFCPP